ncbi:MAG: hypothetical protein HYT42_02330 [Candidatus Sungbacteria bacterium]|nr:hypothetical protein [Candidatus Sungbacteria bacterium]
MAIKMTLEQLARMTQEEFRVTHRKMDEGFKAVADILDLMRADIKGIRITPRR